jgi:UDP-N-acetylmuramoylalanine--D-glutamate ligase
LELGGHRLETFETADLIVISPGVPHTIGPLERPAARHSRHRGSRTGRAVHPQAHLAVSGTNGKTTTTELLGRMLAASGMQVFVGGNIGNPLIEIAGGTPTWI